VDRVSVQNVMLQYLAIRKKPELWKCFNRDWIFQKLWDLFIGLKCVLCIELKNYEWIYFVTYSDTLTSLWGEEEPVILLQGVSKLRLNYECNVLTTSVLLQVSCTVMSDVTLKGGDLLTKLHQRDCCGDVGLKFNVGQLCVDVKCSS